MDVIHPYYFNNQRGRKPSEKIFADVNNRLNKAGLTMHGGTIVDAGSGYVHTITGTSANIHNVSETANLIREDDKVVYGTSGYLGAVNQFAIKDDEKKSMIKFRVNKRPSSLKIADDFKNLK